ncbi:phage terminase large subunit family protein, partial [Morganella morganii]|nr:phage terminase large subunit family protein [Morganella morganii]
MSQKRAVVRPPEALSLSGWANKYAVLSKENAAQTGRFRSFKYQDGIMDAFTDPSVTQVSVMKSARVGYTKILDHAVAYYLSHDPSPILVVQPRVEDAEDYSKTEIAPMLRDTPVLKAIAGEAKAKDSGQTILKKQFSNGANLTLVGA